MPLQQPGSVKRRSTGVNDSAESAAGTAVDAAGGVAVTGGAVGETGGVAAAGGVVGVDGVGKGVAGTRSTGRGVPSSSGTYTTEQELPRTSHSVINMPTASRFRICRATVP